MASTERHAAQASDSATGSPAAGSRVWSRPDSTGRKTPELMGLHKTPGWAGCRPGQHVDRSVDVFDRCRTPANR